MYTVPYRLSKKMDSHVDNEDTDLQNPQDPCNLITNDLAKPVIISCSSCNAIFSDSLAFVVDNADLKTVTLSRVSSNVTQSPELVTSTDGFDKGSAFSPLVCGGCQSEVGKVYKTTPKFLDNLRDFCTFESNKLCSYQVGPADTTLSPGEVHNGNEACLKAINKNIPKQSGKPVTKSRGICKQVDQALRASVGYMKGVFCQNQQSGRRLEEIEMKLQAFESTTNKRFTNIEQKLEEKVDTPSNLMAEHVGSNLTGIGSVAASGSGSKPAGASQRNGRIQNSEASGRRVRSVSPDAARSSDGVAQIHPRSGALSRANADSQLLSDAESSGIESLSSRGEGGARKSMRNSSSQTDTRGRKRNNQLREEEEVEEDTGNQVDHKYDNSPNRKKQNSQSTNKLH